MSIQNLDKILRKIQKATHYTGGELNSAVKNPEPKMFIPMKINAAALMITDLLVSSKRTGSYPTKIPEMVSARRRMSPARATPPNPMSTMLFLKRFFSSSWFCAP